MPQDFLWLNGTTKWKKHASVLSMLLLQHSMNITMTFLIFIQIDHLMLPAESFNAKIKAFRASLRGIVDEKFFLYRLAKIYAYPH